MATMMEELNAMIARAAPTKVFTPGGDCPESSGYAPPSVSASHRAAETGRELRDQEEGREPADDGASIKSSSYYTGTAATPSQITPAVEPAQSKVPTRDCNFDTNPTNLYMMIQDRQWAAATDRATAYPDEAQTWVSRFEPDGKLRWRLLPIHAAIIFRAPDRLVEALLCSFPAGAQCKDDQGMLPIHLAFRNGSSEGVVNLLLVAYPQSIEVKDRKGRIPLVLAQASSSPNREAFIRAIERGPSYYAVAAAATERAAVTAEQRAIFETKLMATQREHNEEKERIRSQAEEEKKRVIKEKANIEAEMAKNAETSKVLVEHVASLEAQLTSRSDTERFLASKIATLDGKVKEATEIKEKVEIESAAKVKVVDDENVRLKQQISMLQSDLDSAKTRASTAENDASYVRRKTEEELSRAKSAYRELEKDATNTRATALALEDQLKSKIKMEHSLANQVSELASRLAESAATATTNSRAYTAQVEEIESEKAELRGVVEVLTKKLIAVSEALDRITKEQAHIVEAAAAHERTVLASAEAQRSIVEEVTRQDIAMQEASSERDQMMAVLTKQAKDAEDMGAERRRLMESVRTQVSEMESATQQREELMNAVERQRTSMDAVRDDHLTGLNELLDDAMMRARERVASIKSAGVSSNIVTFVPTTQTFDVDEDEAEATETSRTEEHALESVDDNVIAAREGETNTADAVASKTTADTLPSDSTVAASGGRFSYYTPGSEQK